MSPVKKLMMTCLLPLLIASVFTVSASLSRDTSLSNPQDLNSWIDTFDSYEKVYLVLSSMVVAGFSLVNVIRHLLKFKSPSVQGRIVSVVILPCVYTVTSFIGLSMSSESALNVTVLDAVNETYSAFALLMFFDLVCEYLVMMVGRDMDNLPHRRVLHNKFPIYYLQPYELDVSSTSIPLYRKYTLRYLIIRVVGSVIVLTLIVIAADIVSEWAGYIFTLVSIIFGYIALVAVWTLYLAVEEDIHDFKPGKKFLCLKASAFFSFSQMLIIYVIQWLGFFDDISLFKIQNNVMMGEMALISILMFCYYPRIPAAPRNRDLEMAEDVRHKD